MKADYEYKIIGKIPEDTTLHNVDIEVFFQGQRYDLTLFTIENIMSF